MLITLWAKELGDLFTLISAYPWRGANHVVPSMALGPACLAQLTTRGDHTMHLPENSSLCHCHVSLGGRAKLCYTISHKRGTCCTGWGPGEDVLSACQVHAAHWQEAPAWSGHLASTALPSTPSPFTSSPAHFYLIYHVKLYLLLRVTLSLFSNGRLQIHVQLSPDHPVRWSSTNTCTSDEYSWFQRTPADLPPCLG